MDLHAACRAASETAARIDARIKTKLMKRACRLGMTTNEREVAELVEVWKQAAKHTKRLHLRDARPSPAEAVSEVFQRRPAGRLAFLIALRQIQGPRT